MTNKNISQSAADGLVLPGIKPVLELLRSEPGRVDIVYCRQNLRGPELAEIQQCCRRRGIRFRQVESTVLDRLCRRSRGADGVAGHQGVAARLAAATFTDLPALIAAVATAPLPLLVALDQVRDPGNVGALARTMYALGCAGLLLPEHNGAGLGLAARRAAVGALEHLPVARATNLGHALDSCEEAGLHIYGATGDSHALNAFANPMRLPAVLVLGSEEKGLRPGIAKRCGEMLRIPHARRFDSLNVAQAGAILIGLCAAGHDRPGNARMFS